LTDQRAVFPGRLTATEAGSAEPCYIGVDPGLRRTGYALLQRTRRGPVLKEAGVIRTSATDSLAARVGEIGRGLRDVLDEFLPAMLAVEQVFSFGRNPKTALLMAHARGAVLMVATEAHIPVLHYTPTQVKRILTGSGRASKEQMQLAIRREFGLRKILQPNDVADAAAVALCLYHSVTLSSGSVTGETG